MECYIKTPEGEWHTNRGMVRPLSVTENPSGASAPEADLELTLSKGQIQASGRPAPGRQTVAVHFGERPEGALFLGNDVHLVRLEEGTDLEELARWLDPWKVDGFRAPAPAEFLGGTQDMPRVPPPTSRSPWSPARTPGDGGAHRPQRGEAVHRRVGHLR